LKKNDLVVLDFSVASSVNPDYQERYHGANGVILGKDGDGFYVENAEGYKNRFSAKILTRIGRL